MAEEGAPVAAEEGASMRCGSTNKPQMCDVSSTPYKGRRLLISVPQLRGAHHSHRSARPPLRSDVAPSDLLPHSAHVRPLGVLASSREFGGPGLLRTPVL